MKRRNKKQTIEHIINYIKDNTANGEPIILRSIDLSTIAKIPQSSCIRLLREIRAHDKIIATPLFPNKKSSIYNFIHVDNVDNAKNDIKEDEDSSKTEKLTEELIKIEDVKENKELIKNEEQDDPSNVLCNNLKQFENHIDNFKNFIAETIDFVKNGHSSKELKNNLEQSQLLIEKILFSNSGLEDEIAKLKEEKESLNKYIKALKDCNDNVIGYMQQRLQIVIAEITNQSKEYVNTPKWLINEGFDAKFEKIIVNIITEAIDDIMSNNTNVVDNS